MFSLQNGHTSLHDEDHPGVVKLLIESGAKLDIKDNVSVEVLVGCMGMGS